AEVIKIETPGEGDPLRKWRRLHEGSSLWWYAQARNKKSVAVNLREAEGQEIVRRLAADADIVVENFRPGTMERWGLGYEHLAALNARTLTGKGQVVDVALYEAVFAMMESMLPEFGMDGYVRSRTGASLPGIVPSNTYPCRDGQYVVIGANADSIFKRMMRAI